MGAVGAPGSTGSIQHLIIETVAATVEADARKSGFNKLNADSETVTSI